MHLSPHKLLPALIAACLSACGGTDTSQDSTAPGSAADQQSTEPGVETAQATGSLSVTLGDKEVRSEEPVMVKQGRWGAKEDMLHLVIRGLVESEERDPMGLTKLQYDIYLRPAEVGEHPFLQQVRKTSVDRPGVCLQVAGPGIPVLNGMNEKGTLTITACELEGDTNDTLVVKRFAATFEGTFKHGDAYGDGPLDTAKGSIDYTR